MKPKKTHAEFEKELFKITPNIQVLDMYVNANTKIKFKCLKHNLIFESLPCNILKGHGCKLCGKEKQSKSQTKSQEIFIKQIEIINPDITIIGEYTGYKTKLKTICNKDGYEWNIEPYKLLGGSKCPVCQNKKVMIGVNDIATTRPDIARLFKNQEDIHKYVAGSEHYVDVVCPDCKSDVNIRITNLSRFGLSCPVCHGNKYGRNRVRNNYWNKDTLSEFLDNNARGYKVIDFISIKQKSGSVKKVYIKCPNEKHEPYWSYMKNIIDGYRCQKCVAESSSSKGELKAIEIFKNNNISYIPQHKFSDCKDRYVLPFDFYLPDYNLIIEIMGEQHEHPVEIFGGEEQFKIQIFHDKIKRDYLHKNNIHILDIWYYDFKNMEQIIINKINELINIKI